MNAVSYPTPENVFRNSEVWRRSSLSVNNRNPALTRCRLHPVTKTETDGERCDRLSKARAGQGSVPPRSSNYLLPIIHSFLSGQFCSC